MIKENLKILENELKDTNTTLVAVSKTKPTSDILEAYKEGIRDFGENKAQELDWKYNELPKDIRWHMIGHLQRNKVKYIIDKVYLIHSVDSLRLAEQINNEALKINKTVNILIQVNVSGEESKFGINPDESFDLIDKISKMSNVKIMGLMTVAPFTSNPEENRTYFSELKKLYVDIISKNIDNVSMELLSMGMTGDYKVAISEGANLIRVGTGVFGERHYE